MRANCQNCVMLVVMACAALLSSSSVTSQVLDGVPHLISYQGRLTDVDSDPVSDGEHLITFTIWDDSLSTAPSNRKWISPNCPVLVINGLFNWQLGARENLPPWTTANSTNLWLGIQVESDPEIAPRTRLCSAPYAYKAWQSDYAEYADSAGTLVTGGPAAGWVDDGPSIRLNNAADYVGIGVTIPTQRLDVDGTVKSTGFMMPTGHADGYVLTSDESGEGHWLEQPDQVTSSCCGTEVAATTGTGSYTIYFPIIFPDEPYLSVSIVKLSGLNGGTSCHAANFSFTGPGGTEVDAAHFDLQYYNGTTWTDIGGGVMVQVSYTAVEK